jgi:cell division protein FtsI (penicillin-binding protein 3)
MVRLFHLQVLKREFYSSIAETQIRGKRDLPVSRGEIRDRNNRVLTLNLDVDSLAVNPKLIKNKDRLSLELSKALSMSPVEIRNKFESNSYFVWIKRQIDSGVSRRLRRLKKTNFPELDFRKETKRYYPLGNVACHLVGAVGVDGEGLSGIEFMFNEQLIKKGLSEAYKKVGMRRKINLSSGKPSEHVNVVLTIDATLQYIAQKELEKIRDKYRPKRAFVVIQDPSTGEILTLACIPSFYPGSCKFGVKDLNNPVINGVFEPGSVFKIVPAGALLAENIYKPTDLIYCENGKYRITDSVIINDHEKYKYLTFKGMMAYSSNIGFAKTGMKLGREKLYSWIRKFGFGSTTGSKLPGEQRGIVPLPRSRKWTYVTAPIICYGQGIAVTGLQLINAYSVIANGGLLMEPKVVKALVDTRDELVWHFEPIVVRRVISENVAKIIRNMLKEAVTYGTGKKASVEGYKVAGKTGTAQKIDPVTKKYCNKGHIASFCGFIPADAPELTILVVVDEPQGIYWASDVASPAFSNIAEEAMNYWSIKKGKKDRYAYVR